MINNFLHTLAVVLGLGVVLPIVLGSMVVVISRANKRSAVLLGGFYAQVIFGGLGVIIHELSHLVVAIIFGHHIQQVRLLRIPNSHDPHDQSLGFVNHTWNDDSLYQKIGNVFIGIAPVIGCALAMVWGTRILVPSFYNQWLVAIGGRQITEHPSAWWQWLVWLLLMVNISIGGFDLSPADLQNSRQGIVALTVIILLGSFGSNLIWDYQTIYVNLSHLIRSLIAMMAFAIAINLILWGIMRLDVWLRSH